MITFTISSAALSFRATSTPRLSFITTLPWCTVTCPGSYIVTDTFVTGEAVSLILQPAYHVQSCPLSSHAQSSLNFLQGSHCAHRLSSAHVLICMELVVNMFHSRWQHLRKRWSHINNRTPRPKSMPRPRPSKLYFWRYIWYASIPYQWPYYDPRGCEKYNFTKSKYLQKANYIPESRYF